MSIPYLLFSSSLPCTARGLHGLPDPENEYSSKPNYPKIPASRTRDQEEAVSLQETMRALKTAEEKQYFLNKPKYFGWYVELKHTDLCLKTEFHP